MNFRLKKTLGISAYAAVSFTVIIAGCSNQRKQFVAAGRIQIPLPEFTPPSGVSVTRKNVTSRTLYRHPRSRTDYTYPSSFSNDGLLFASIASEEETQTLRIWDTRSGRIINTHRIPNIHEFAISPDNRTVAVITGHRARQHTDIPYAMYLIDRHSGSVRRSFMSNFTAMIHKVCFSPDGELLVTNSGDAVMRVWRVRDARRLAMVSRCRPWHFISDDRIACSVKDGTFAIFNVASKKLHASGFVSGASIAMTNDGRTLASQDWDRRVLTFRLPELKKLGELYATGPEDESTSQLALSSNGRRLALTRGRYVTIHDTASLSNVVANFDIDNTGVLALYLSPSGHEIKWVTYGSAINGAEEDYRIRLWHATKVS